MEVDQGVMTAPPAGSGATAPVQSTEPTGSEPVTNPGSTSSEHTVPFDRFQAANDKAKAAEERAAKAEQETETLRGQQSQSSDDDEDDDIEPNVRSLVTRIIKKEGYVKKDEVTATVQATAQAQELKRQYQQDTVDLTAKYASTGVPFVPEAVRDYAKENGINITNRASLEATYNVMNSGKILENARNAAIAEYKEGGKLSGEKPGSSGASTPAEPEVRGLKNRIASARQKYST